MQLRLVGWTRSERHDVTSCVTDAIAASGGFVLGSRQFSNTALTLSLQIPRKQAADLATALESCSLMLEAASAAELERCSKEDGAEQDVSGTLHIKYLHDEPDLRIPTPAVPG